MEPTNEDRADWAEDALEYYSERVGDTAEEQPTAVVDLLGDLMHFCNRRGFNFSTLLATAEMHYDAETEEEA